MIDPNRCRFPVSLACLAMLMTACASTPHATGNPREATAASEVQSQSTAQDTAQSSEATVTRRHRADDDIEAARARAMAEISRGTLVVGDPAPDFTLADENGAGEMSLSALRGKPVVLVFGSCTCPPFVRSNRATAALERRYGDRVHFLMVYIREAHPTDGWALPDNRFEVATPRTIEERRAIARDFKREIPPRMPMLVDTIESSVAAYAPFPNRLYVIDAAGLVAHVGEPGPQSTLTSARAAPAVLDRLLRGR